MISPGGGNVVPWFYPAQLKWTEAFPQPFSLYRIRKLRITNVPLGATVIVLMLDGIELARIDGIDPIGGARWQPRLAKGSPLPEGVYLYRIRLMDGTEPIVQKFVVIP